MGKRTRFLKRARRAIDDGLTPAFDVDVRRREVPALPGITFGGRRPAEIAEAARRSIAAELGVRPEQILVRPIADVADASADDDREGAA